MTRNRKIISFISAKGGSGKTALSVSIAALLSEMDFRVVLVDLDLATHGAAYFFQDLIEDAKGLIEVVESEGADEFSPMDTIKLVRKNLWFIPSKSSLRLMSDSVSITHRADRRNKLVSLLKKLIGHAEAELKVDYIILDCQAGVSYTTELAAEACKRAVTVLEHDTISARALKALETQIAKKLPTDTWNLINKLRVREASSYKDKASALRGLTHLPPIPFDWEVREAYGEAQIPGGLDKPSTFLFALFRALKVLLPEIRERLEKFEEERIDILFDQYTRGLSRATEEKAKLRDELEELETRQRSQLSVTTQVVSISAVAASVIAGLLSAAFVIDLSVAKIAATLTALIAISLMGVAYYVLTASRARAKEAAKAAAIREKLESEIHDAEREIERFQSYLYSRSEQFIVDFQQ